MKAYLVSFYGEITVEANSEEEAKEEASSELSMVVDWSKIGHAECFEDEDEE